MTDEMVSEGAPALDNDSVTYQRGWDAGYRTGIDESKTAIDGAYDDGFKDGHTSGYQDAVDEQAYMNNRKAPPEFSEPFGAEE